MSGKPSRARFAARDPRFRGRCRGAVALAAVALLAVGCGGTDSASDLPPAPEPDATYGGVLPAAQAPAPEGFTAAEIEGVRINSPEGWEVDNAGGQLCMRPPGQPECGYGAIQVLPKAAERDAAQWPNSGNAYHQDDGWAADPSACRSLNTVAAGDVGISGAEYRRVGDGLTTHADGLKSHYSTWLVTCENDETFEVRLWFLPQSDVAVYVPSVDQRYDGLYLAVAESMDVTEYNS